LRDERLPKGPQFASESLDADTGSGTDLKLYHYRFLPLLTVACRQSDET